MSTMYNPYPSPETETNWVKRHIADSVVLHPYLAGELLAAREDLADQAPRRLTRILLVIPVAVFTASVLLAHFGLRSHAAPWSAWLTGVLVGAAFALAAQVVLEAWPIHAIRVNALTREISDVELWTMRLRSTGGIGNQPANVLFNPPVVMQPSVKRVSR